MIGSFNVKVTQRMRVSFEFTVRRNVTIVCGDSGTGKTTLFNMLVAHTRERENSGVTIQCDRPCVALIDLDWENQLAGITDSIVFIDEGMRGVFSEDFARVLSSSSNYFVIISREALSNIPYSIDEIYEIKASGKRHTFVPRYTRRDGYRYSLSKALPKKDFDTLLTEDSRSGLQFFKARFDNQGVSCCSSKGNANIVAWLKAHRGEYVFAIADGAAFGAQSERVMKLQDEFKDSIALCLPESFEWLILKSGVVKADDLQEVLDDPAAFIDSSKDGSWEQFFSAYLRQITEKTPFAYNKSELAEAYTLSKNADRVMALIACRNIK